MKKNKIVSCLLIFMMSLSISIGFMSIDTFAWSDVASIGSIDLSSLSELQDYEYRAIVYTDKTTDYKYFVVGSHSPVFIGMPNINSDTLGLISNVTYTGDIYEPEQLFTYAYYDDTGGYLSSGDKYWFSGISTISDYPNGHGGVSFGDSPYIYRYQYYDLDTTDSWDVDPETGEIILDYGEPSLLVTTVYSGVEFDITGYGSAYTTGGLRIIEISSADAEISTDEMLAEGYTLIEYAGPFDFTQGIDSFIYHPSPLYDDEAKGYRYEVPMYDDGELITTLFAYSSNIVRAYEPVAVEEDGDVIFDGFSIVYNETTMGITSIVSDYEDLTIHISNEDQTEEYATLTGIDLQRMVETEVGYGFEPEWHKTYYYEITQTNILGFEQGLYSNTFTYGYTSASDSDTDLDIALENYEDLEDVTSSYKEMITQAQDALAVYAMLFAMFPYPLNYLLLFVVSSAVMVLVVGIGFFFVKLVT